jgi:hypothetical protein
MEIAGTKYKSSNKIDTSHLFKNMILILISAFLCGIIFERISYLFGVNVFLQFVFKVLMGLSCLGLSIFFIDKFESRNLYFDTFIILTISILSWYTLWAKTLSLFEETNFFTALIHPIKIFTLFINVQSLYENYGFGFFSDTLAFFISIFVAFGFPDSIYTYYCENCKTSYSRQYLYVNDAESFEKDFSKTDKGCYHFINYYNCVYTENKLRYNIDLGKSFAIKITYYHCKKCEKNSIVDIAKDEILYYDNKEKDKTSETEYYLANEPEILVSGIYVDDITQKIINQKFNL